jgi:hypothetical protein
VFADALSWCSNQPKFDIVPDVLGGLAPADVAKTSRSIATESFGLKRTTPHIKNALGVKNLTNMTLIFEIIGLAVGRR